MNEPSTRQPGADPQSAPEDPELEPADPELEPAEPEDVGVAEKEPPPMQIEPARLLANQARDRLYEQGFDDEQIEAWADTYVAEGTGDVEDFIAWIAEQEAR